MKWIPPFLDKRPDITRYGAGEHLLAHTAMKRDIQSLVTNQYDVLVLGAGVHGASIASACAQAGLTTALIEKKDFGHATSANSLKIIHGGLRYLQHLNIKRMRDTIISRKHIMQQAPHCVRPLCCLIPNHGRGLHSNFLMRAALFVNDLIGYDRNSGSGESHVLLNGEVISKSRLFALFPEIVKAKTTGASIWYDAFAVNSEDSPSLLFKRLKNMVLQLQIILRP